MGKATGVGSIVFGVILIFLGIGAWATGEAAMSDNGNIAVGFAIILGLLAILGGVTARQKEGEKAKQASQAAPTTTATAVTNATTDLPPPPPDEAQGSFCPYCGKGIQSDFVACPFCGKSVKKTCSKCGKELRDDFMACPYCGTPLKKD